MAATRSDIERWLKGAPKTATHLIVVCDTYDWDDYPVYVEEGEDARAKADEYRTKSMQQVMEVYNLKMNIEAQLNEHRAFNY